MTNEIMQFEVVRNVTLPFLIMTSDGTDNFVKFDSAILPDTSTFSERVRKTKTSDGGPQSTDPMHIALVTNLQTGEVCRLVAHQVLESNLNECYPNDGYVGKYFKITKQKAAKGRYFNFNIIEIKLKAKAEAPKK